MTFLVEAGGYLLLIYVSICTVDNYGGAGVIRVRSALSRYSHDCSESEGLSVTTPPLSAGRPTPLAPPSERPQR